MSNAKLSEQTADAPIIRQIVLGGDRNWDDEKLIEHVLGEYRPCILRQGGCRGADSLAKKVGKRLGFDVRTHMADWNRHGLHAGPIRNRVMLDTAMAECPRKEEILVLALHDDIAHSKGTKDLVKQANQRGLNTIQICHAGMQKTMDAAFALADQPRRSEPQYLE